MNMMTELLDYMQHLVDKDNDKLKEYIANKNITLDSKPYYYHRFISQRDRTQMIINWIKNVST
jgi:hypothetical protein